MSGTDSKMAGILSVEPQSKSLKQTKTLSIERRPRKSSAEAILKPVAARRFLLSWFMERLRPPFPRTLVCVGNKNCPRGQNKPSRRTEVHKNGMKARIAVDLVRLATHTAAMFTTGLLELTEIAFTQLANGKGLFPLRPRAFPNLGCGVVEGNQVAWP